ncbi:MAG: TonB-dependent receptor domain-containing protein [Acidobacteriota bacterium]
MRKTLTLFLALALLSILSSPALAQESRGSILGTVTDAQKAVVPGAEIVVTNVGTNQSRTTVSNDAGYYEVPLLDPGDYTVSAELAGFKKYVRSGIVLNVASKVSVDIQLEVGEVQQIVEVTAAAPLLETTSASAGRIIDTEQIASLPFSDLNPFALTAMAPGMQWTGQPEYRRPFDNGGTSAFSTAGGVGQNEYSIDGAVVTGTDRRVGFVPPADAIQEFNLQTSSFDASTGHTSGAVVNVMSKSGTNAFHGTLYDQHWQQRWNATPHFTRIAWEKAGDKNAPKQAPGRSNQFGATLGGPVRIPWLYNGTDKFFFFFSYNGIYQSKAETTDSIWRNVPKMAWRNGDFSDLLALDPAKYTIYDPRTARLEGGKVVRDPFPGNKGIPILNPLYKFYAKLYPVPNDVPGAVTPEGENNYYAANMPKDEKFNSILNRLDYNISDNHRLYGKWFWNHRLADEYDWTYETMRGLHANGLTRINKGGSGDWTWTINSNWIFQLGLNYARFNEGNDSPVRTQFKPSDVGLPAYLDERAADLHMMPRLDFDTIEDFSSSWPAIHTRASTGELRLALVSILGAHSVKYGYSERRYWTARSGPGNTSGNFQFRRDFMRKDDQDTKASHLGLEWASFMMGLPNAINIDRNDSAFLSTRFRSFYIQDDWRLNSKLTLNLGLRYEREGGITERFNRALSGEFDPTIVLPISAAAEAAYAKIYADNQASSKPIQGLPTPDQFKVLGGTHYLGEINNDFTDGTHHFLPRLGLVYRLLDKTVIRLGYGWYYDTLNAHNAAVQSNNIFNDGFSQPTGTTLSNDRGLTFCCGVGAAGSLSATSNPFIDPFPVRADGTRFDEPIGNALGPMIRTGRGWGRSDRPPYPRDFEPAFQQRWRFGIQHQLWSNMVVEGSYNGAYSRTPQQYRIDFLPEQYWEHGNKRNDDRDKDLNSNVPNPFNIKYFSDLQTSNPALYKWMSTQGFYTGTTIRKHELLRSFPQMGDLYGIRPGDSFKKVRGVNQYHDYQLSMERRMSNGFSMSFAYTHTFNAKEKDWLANEFDSGVSWRPTDQLSPNRFMWQTILQLPFGRNGRWAKEGVLEKIAAGWEMSWIWQWQDGIPLSFGNRFFYGDMNKLKDIWKHEETFSKDVHQWFSKDITWNPHPTYFPEQYAYCQQLLSTATPDVNKCDPPASFVGFEGRSAKQPGNFHIRMTPERFPDLRRDGIDNWDIKVQRRISIREQVNVRLSVDLLNAFNHTNFSDPNRDPTSPAFGQTTSQRGLSRIIQLNLRIDF